VLAALGATHVLRVAMRAHGSTLGVLHIAGAADQLDVPRALELAHRAALALAAARVYEERAALAETLRAALLPPALPTIPGVEVGARYRAAQETTEIGGDFYEVSPLGDGRWTLSLGDVCGKGVDAAVLTGQVRQSLRTAVLANADPPASLELLNAAMLATDGTRFVTILHGLMSVEEDGVRIRLACGGHPQPLVLRSDGQVETVKAYGTLVGMLPGVRFGASDIYLAPGETLLMYTDGITEARVGNELLGPERLIAMFADCRGMPAQSVTERVEQFVLEYLNGRPHDDLAILALRATGSAS
jgi:serine phosphatase RsbU (regulator of sigma subunit)